MRDSAVIPGRIFLVAVVSLIIMLSSHPGACGWGERTSAPYGRGEHISGDTTPPKVNITYPQNGSTLRGGVVVRVNATDDTGIDHVEIRIDSTHRANLSSEPYNWEWNTRDTPNGTHTLNATAYDTSGNFNWSMIYIILDNDFISPSVAIISPKDGEIISGDVAIIANASDDRGNISLVTFSIDGVVRSANDTPAGPYRWVWNTSMEKNGVHKINFTAYDYDKNNASVEITVNVQNIDKTPPVIRIDSPGENSEVFDSVVIYLWAEDDIALKKVEVLIDFKVVYTNISGLPGTYTYEWDTRSTSNGVHIIKAIAEDTSGNNASHSILVTVSNIPSPQVTSPQPEDTLRGVVLIEGSVNSLLITEVHVRIDDFNWSVANGTTNWKIYWNTTKVENGAHNLSFRATDGKRYSPTITMRVYVDNPPLQCIILSPREKENVSGEVNITGMASSGTLWVEVSIDGSNWTKAKGNITWYIYWDTLKETNGNHTINARAYNEIWKMYTPIFSVNVRVSNPEKKTQQVISPEITGGAIALLIIVLILLYFYLLGKKKPEYPDEEVSIPEKKKEKPVKPEQIKRKTKRKTARENGD